MVLSKSVYNSADYWEGGITGVKLAWGYTGINGYLEELNENRKNEVDTFTFNGEFGKLWDRIQGQDFTNATILEIGGATGYLSKIAKHYFPSITYDVVDLSTYWTITKPSIEPTVDTYYNEDIIDRAQGTGSNGFKNNSYDVIISRLSLECLTDTELAILIPKLNSWCRVQQVHIFSNPENINQQTITEGAYNLKSLSEWALMGFESGTILRDREGNEVIV